MSGVQQPSGLPVAGEGISVSGPTVSLGPGVKVLINASETTGTDVNTTTSETVTKTYSLAANSYTSIEVEGDVALYNGVSDADNLLVTAYIGSTARLFGASAMYIIHTAGTSTASAPQIMVHVSLTAALTAGGTVKITITPNASSASLGGVAYNMRVWGIV